MDDEVDALSNTLSTLETTELKSSDYEELYKNWGKVGSQEERRKELLNIQKSNRTNKIDRFRGILEIVTAVEKSDLFKSPTQVYYRPNIYVAGFHKASLTYSNVLMLSEWLIEKPQDFEENWSLIPCPKAIRTLIVACNGITKFYTKYGHFKFQNRTALPGGNPCEPNRKNCCVLDGFYYEKSKTAYVLDILAWNNQPMTDGETEFRHYWLKTQLDEKPGLKVLNKKNQVYFEMLPVVPCTSSALSDFFKKYPIFEDNNPPLDGLLFYHKRSHYVSGETPLVGWLYPYMVPEVLGSNIVMNSDYMAEKPQNYVNQTEFIKEFEVKYAKKNKHKERRSSGMEVETNKTEATKSDSSETKENESMDTEEESKIKEENTPKEDNTKTEDMKTEAKTDNKEDIQSEQETVSKESTSNGQTIDSEM